MVDSDQFIEQLAEKLGVAVEVIKPVAEETLRQVALRGCANVVIGIGMLWLFLGVTYLCVRLVKKCCAGGSESEFFGVMAFLAGVFSLTMLIAGGIHVSEGIGEWLAPLPTILGL